MKKSNLLRIMLIFSILCLLSASILADSGAGELLAMLRSKDPVKKATAANQIARTGVYPDGAIEALISCLGDFSRLMSTDRLPGVQIPEIGKSKNETSPNDEAVKALVRIGNPAVAPLIEALKKNDLWATEQAAKCLGLLKDKRALPSLTAMIDQGRVTQVVIAVARIGGTEVYDTLYKAFELSKSNGYKSQFGSYEPVLALGYSQDKRFLPLLIDLTQNEDIGIKNAGISGLGYLKNPEALKRLHQLLNDPLPLTRSYSCEALGNIGSPQSKKFLQDLLLKEQDANVVFAAKQALASLGKSTQ